MSFGKRGAGPANPIRSGIRAPATAPVLAAPMPDAPSAHEATHIPVQVKQFAWASLVAIALALAYVAWNHAIAAAIEKGDQRGAAETGRPMMPYALLRGTGASWWTFGGCTLRSEAFLPRGAAQLVLNNIGNLESEGTIGALSAAAGFMSCIARKSDRDLCDASVRARLVADVTTFYARHARTSALVMGMSSSSGPGGKYGVSSGPMAGFNPMIKAKQESYAAALAESDALVGSALQTLAVGGYVKLSDFGWRKPEPVTRYLTGITAQTKACQ